ncbi:hypothetical protein KSB_60810 [Ktedonobacter robiniae]|uniref:Uncharacterized protein n=1 Tax=Ktedonobacter robiniae TaxID=2778365 RepID=A0ABQ3UXK3_9CHLR|nr:hypothetical protein KSB_60810 [Ktedonobacter robiniae]
MSLQQSIHLPSPQGLLFFEKNEHPAHDKPSHLLSDFKKCSSIGNSCPFVQLLSCLIGQ